MTSTCRWSDVAYEPTVKTGTRAWKSDALLLLAAAIWGLAFVAQRVGMTHVGPFAFNGARFLLGSVVLIPVLLVTRRQAAWPRSRRRTVLLGGMLAGMALFAASSCQQIGLVYTTAGKAGFITGLYVVIVPILGLFWRQRVGLGTWVGAILAAVGLYLLSVVETLTLSPGDALVLLGAFGWAGHVHLIGWLSARTNPVGLAFCQYVACAVLSLLVAALTETPDALAVLEAAIPILYAGGMSVGVAYTLQVVAQREAPPAHAAIILSLEAVFAGVSGWLVLGETLSLTGLLGCDLMLTGMIMSQLSNRRPSGAS